MSGMNIQIEIRELFVLIMVSRERKDTPSIAISLKSAHQLQILYRLIPKNNLSCFIAFFEINDSLILRTPKLQGNIF